jgi:hypothetical protein
MSGVFLGWVLFPLLIVLVLEVGPVDKRAPCGPDGSYGANGIYGAYVIRWPDVEHD